MPASGIDGMPSGPPPPPVHVDKRVSEFPTPSAQPFGLAWGPDSNLWFTDGASSTTTPGGYDDIVGRMSPTGDVTEFHTVTPGSSPGFIINGPDGALWFTEQNANAIGRITTAGVTSEFMIPTPGSVPAALAVGSDGAIWFAEEQANKIGRLTTTGTFSEFPLPMVFNPNLQSPGVGSPDPWQIVAGSDGALWFTESQAMIGRITTSGVVTSFPSSPSPGANAVTGLTVGVDGALWFVYSTDLQGEWVTHRFIGRMTTAGTTTAFQLADDGDSPRLLAQGPDGNIWATEVTGNKLIRLTPAGKATELVAAGPMVIIPGPDGNMWFSEPYNGAIGRVNVGEVGG